MHEASQQNVQVCASKNAIDRDSGSEFILHHNVSSHLRPSNTVLVVLWWIKILIDGFGLLFLILFGLLLLKHLKF